MTEIVIGNNG